jgi:c-di-GMP-binding flagellar brake protein YcgR
MGADHEQRRFARIEASLVCSVATSTDAFDAVVVNLSKGGVAILGPDGAARTGETITLLVERDGASIALPGEIVRTEGRDERMLYGVQFGALPPDEEQSLVTLLHVLSASKGPGRREHPRVAARISVNCRDEEVFRGWLNDLSKGGLSVRCGKAVSPGDTLAVSFGAAGITNLVEVAGEVVSCKRIDHASWRVGVRFDPLAEEVRAEVARVLDTLLGIALPAGIVVED